MATVNSTAQMQSVTDQMNGQAASGAGGQVSNQLAGFTGTQIPDSTILKIIDASKIKDIQTVAALIAPFTDYPIEFLVVALQDFDFFNSFNPETGTTNSVGLISALSTSLENSFNLFNNSVTEFGDSVLQSYSGSDVTGLADNVSEKISGRISEQVTNIVPNAPDNVKKQIVKDIQNGETDAAAEKAASYSEQSKEELKTQFANLDPTLAGTYVLNVGDFTLPPNYEIGSNFTTWSGKNSQDYDFSYIATVEELNAEVKFISREITEVVVHWTETYTNANLSAEQIHDIHNALGHDGIVYHYIIKRDGSLQRGCPINLQSEHTGGPHDEYSIAIAFVGGINSPSDQPRNEDSNNTASLTRSQFNTFYEILKAMYKRYPGLQVIGHNDIDPLQQDPGFDVIEYCYNKFNKITLFSDPSTQPPFSQEGINNFLKNLSADRAEELSLIRYPWTN